MLFSDKKKIQSDAVKIYIDNENIKKVNYSKFLGLILDEHLNWKAQIGHISTKIYKNIGIILKLRNYLPAFSLKTL